MHSRLGIFVQDDIMYCNLTVEENLLFSARYRLPVHYTHAQHAYYVERAIQVSRMHALLLGCLLIISPQQCKCSVACTIPAWAVLFRLSVGPCMCMSFSACVIECLLVGSYKHSLMHIHIGRGSGTETTEDQCAKQHSQHQVMHSCIQLHSCMKPAQLPSADSCPRRHQE